MSTREPELQPAALAHRVGHADQLHLLKTH
jgi:hypothetical protein